MPTLIPHARSPAPESVLLGLLSQQPAHGYELQRRLTNALGQVWHMHLNQIYNILKRLEARGLVTSTPEQAAGAPPRRRFALTAAGQQTFEDWLQRLTPRNIRAIRVEFTTRLYFAQARDRDLTRRLLREQTASVQEGVARLQAQLATLPVDDSINRLGLALRVRTLAVVLEWLEECRITLRLDEAPEET